MQIVEFKPDSTEDRPRPIPWKEYEVAVVKQWHQLLASDPTEEAVHSFLELHPAMVPGGSGDVGPGGHHGPELGAVFSKPKLKGAGRDFEPDFMWVTRSTTLITPILIEIEQPNKRWFTKNGLPTAEFTQARSQLHDWKSWFGRPENINIFREQFLFSGSYSNRQLQPQFVLIYGRAGEFEPGGGHKDPDALRLKRDYVFSDGETARTFDSLTPAYDQGHRLTVKLSKGRVVPHAFSPVFETDAGVGEDAIHMGDATAAFDRSVMMDDPRREYLKMRWEYWKQKEQDSVRDTNSRRNVIRMGGFE